jgi:hypothetical protein
MKIAIVKNSFGFKVSNEAIHLLNQRMGCFDRVPEPDDDPEQLDKIREYYIDTHRPKGAVILCS